MNTTRLARVAREALLLIRKFMGQGDFQRASEAALKAAEAFNELAKHSSGQAHKIAFKRARILVDITKALRNDEPLPLELVEALDSFFPTETNSLSLSKLATDEPDQVPTELPVEETSDATTTSSETSDEIIGFSQHQLLNGISIACTLTEMLDRATESIRIMVQNFTDVQTVTVGTDNCQVNFIDRLIKKAKADVKIRIIIREPEAFGATAKHFQEAVERVLREAPAVEILVCAQMHIKAIIINASEVLEGSANFTAKGLSGIGEQASWTNNPEFVEQYVTRFDHYWVHQSPDCTECKTRTCEIHPLTRRTQNDAP
ncbi:MAG: phospholipase D family protein [Candidatus Hermodarchaeota archaeon]|nr:phospholipase D family protein [Candidatus Hermodarchaeota archaeon]